MSITVPGRRVHLADVRDAGAATYRAAVRPPLIRPDLSDVADSQFELCLKLEVLQPNGSFKIRGACNVLRQLTETELKDGVWTDRR